MISAKRREQIENVLRTQLGSHGYEACTIEDGPDSNGDPAIFIVASFKEPGHLPSSRVTIDAMFALSDALRSLGDDRFPYLDYKYPEEPIEDEAA